MKKILPILLAVVLSTLFVSCDIEIPELGDIVNAYSEPTRGEFEENVYTSDYLGLTFNKPASWLFFTDEEIAQAMNIGAEYLGEKFEEALKNNPTVYDMMAVDVVTRTNINVGYENLSKTFSTNITVKQYVEALKSQLSQTHGLNVSFPEEYDTVKLGENNYTRVICETKMAGTSMTQVFYLRKINGYMGFVIVTITNGYTVEQIEAMFN